MSLADRLIARVLMHYECREHKDEGDIYTALRELSERRERERWIPVAERLPEGDRLTLARYGDASIRLLYSGYVHAMSGVKEWREVPE